jgi:hypothetical protein
MNPVLVASTKAITIPYDFEVIDFSGAGTEQLNIDLVSTPFINQVGSIAVTLWSILESYNILFLFVLFIVALGVLWWLFSVVMDRPITPTLNVSGVLDAGVGVYEAYNDTQQFYLEREAEGLKVGQLSFRENMSAGLLPPGERDSGENFFNERLDNVRGRQANLRRQGRAVRAGASGFKKISRSFRR